MRHVGLSCAAEVFKLRGRPAICRFGSGVLDLNTGGGLSRGPIAGHGMRAVGAFWVCGGYRRRASPHSASCALGLRRWRGPAADLAPHRDMRWHSVRPVL